MANKIQVKRSSVPAKVPVTTDIDLGEFAVNTYDGSIYIKKDNGTQSIVQVGNVVGPSTSTDNAVARFDLTTGKLIQNSVTTIDDNGNASGILSQQFSDGTAVTVAAGKSWYDGTTGAWNLGMGGGNITQKVGEQIFVYGKASSAISNTNLQLIYKTGTVGASGVITFAPTAASITDASLIFGVAIESIALNSFGRILATGTVNNLNTTGSVYGETWADNDTIWYNPVTGGLTNVKPVAPNIKVQVGTIIKAGSGGSGSFYVEINHGSTLGGTDSNVQITSPATGNVLSYSSSGYWVNSVPTINASTQVTGTLPVANGGTGTTSLTANNVILGNGTSAVQFVAPGTSGNVLTSNGTTWASAAVPAGGLTYLYKTSNYTAADKEGILANTTGGAFTVTLPASPTTGVQVVVADAGGTWGTNNLTVGRNGSTIAGVAQDLVCDIAGASVQLVYDGTTWDAYAQIGGNGGTAPTLSGNNAFTGANTFYNSTGQTFGTATSTQDGLILAGRAGGSSSYRVTLTPTTLTASRTLTLPNASGTLVIGATNSGSNIFLANSFGGF